MMVQIVNGVGNQNKALVDKDNRLHVAAFSSDESNIISIQDGEGYNINTGTISLTTSNTSGLLYLENNSARAVVISSFIYLVGENTGGTSGDTLIEIIRNPTLGTLITGGTAQVPVNRNFSSQNTFDGTSLKGAEGNTITDGVVAIESIFSGNGSGRHVVAVGAVVLRKGNSVGVKVTPRTGTTSQGFQIAASFYMRNGDI